jgi:uncharacterized lipoprotein YehR (DUF1307 family)
MQKSNFVFMVAVICLMIVACSKTKTTIVDSSEVDEDIMLESLFMRDTNPWKEIEKGYYINENGSEIIVTEENRYKSLIQEYEKKFIYPMMDYQTKEEIIRIPQENLKEAAKVFWEAAGLDYSLKKFQKAYNLNDINFIGILQIHEHECTNYVIKEGVGFLQSRVDEPNIYWNIPDYVKTSDKHFNPGDLVKNEIVIEK